MIVQYRGFRAREFRESIFDLRIQGGQGEIPCIFHQAGHASGAVIWVGGVEGSLNGPASALYARLSQDLKDQRIASLRLSYRYPNYYEPCVEDMLVGIRFLKSLQISHIALVGHSFGSAVVITAAGLDKDVSTVVTLSAQTYGTQLIDKIAPRPILLLHGEKDRNLPPDCSEYLYYKAGQPKELILYPKAGHLLEECHEEVYEATKAWLIKKLAGESHGVKMITTTAESADFLKESVYTVLCKDCPRGYRMTREKFLSLFQQMDDFLCIVHHDKA